MNQELRVALVDWNLGVRSARRQILDATSNIKVVFESDGQISQFEQLPDLLIDVIVIDHQLEQGSGIDALLDLRKRYESLADVPPSVLTSTFDLPELRLACLAAGMHDLVSVEGGPEELIGAIRSAASDEKIIDLEQLASLISLGKLAAKSDFGFTQSVNALTVRKKALIEKLAKSWAAIPSGTKVSFSLDVLDPLVSPLGARTTSELVIRLFRSGFLSGS